MENYSHPVVIVICGRGPIGACACVSYILLGNRECRHFPSNTLDNAIWSFIHFCIIRITVIVYFFVISVSRLENLEELDLSNNKLLLRIPVGISKLGKLKSVAFKGCTSMKSPPHVLSRQGISALRKLGRTTLFL